MSAWRDFADLARQTWQHAWRWVLWSPRRWLTVLGVLIVVGVAWSTIVSNQGAGPGPESEDYGDLPEGWESWPTVTATGEPNSSMSPSAGEGDSSSAEPDSAGTEHSGTDEDHGVSDSTRSTVNELAGNFATAYLRDAEPEQWLTGVRSYSTAELGKDLKSVDPDNIPGHGTEPGTVSVMSISEFGGLAEVSTKAGTLVVEMAFSGTEWEVTSVRPPEGNAGE